MTSIAFLSKRIQKYFFRNTILHFFICMQNSNRIIAGRYMIEGGLVNSWETDETNFRLLGKEGF
jgi:hypothetical protein